MERHIHKIDFITFKQRKSWMRSLWRKLLMLNISVLDSPPSQKKPPKNNPNKSPEPDNGPNPSSPQDNKNRKKILDSIMAKQHYFYDHIMCSRC